MSTPRARNWRNTLTIGGCAVALAATAALFGSATANAQEGGRELPNDEPSSYDSLFDRSDSGNITQQAQMSYHSGVRSLKQAEKLEAKLPNLEGKKRTAAEEKIVKAYTGAVESFQDAIRTNPKLVEAYAGLATALRRSGNPAEALKVSSRGLQLAPAEDALFAEWAEAILGLDMLGDATQAYGQLRETNPAWAEVLMGAMQRWLTSHQADPQGLEPEDVQRLADWMNEQGTSTG